MHILPRKKERKREREGGREGGRKEGREERTTKQSWDNNSMEREGSRIPIRFPASRCHWGRAFLSDQERSKPEETMLFTRPGKGHLLKQCY